MLAILVVISIIMDYMVNRRLKKIQKEHERLKKIIDERKDE